MLKGQIQGFHAVSQCDYIQIDGENSQCVMDKNTSMVFASCVSKFPHIFSSRGENAAQRSVMPALCWHHRLEDVAAEWLHRTLKSPRTSVSPSDVYNVNIPAACAAVSIGVTSAHLHFPETSESAASVHLMRKSCGLKTQEAEQERPLRTVVNHVYRFRMFDIFISNSSCHKTLFMPLVTLLPAWFSFRCMVNGSNQKPRARRWERLTTDLGAPHGTTSFLWETRDMREKRKRHFKV